jgi:hypothetical protein
MDFSTLPRYSGPPDVPEQADRGTHRNSADIGDQVAVAVAVAIGILFVLIVLLGFLAASGGSSNVLPM